MSEMNDDQDFLDIFQDPLLTFIALVLMSTLWVVLPQPVERGAATSDQRKPLSTVTQEIERIEKENRELDLKIQKWDRLRSVNTIKQASNALTQEISQLREKVASLRKRVTTQNDIASSKKGAVTKNISEYSKRLTEGKEVVSFIAAKNKVFLENREAYRDNYELTQVSTNQSGVQLQLVELELKNRVRGESIKALQSKQSEFQKALRRHSPDEQYILFNVHNSAFAAFREARKIALQQGYAVNWVPRVDQSYVCISPEAACRQVSVSMPNLATK